MQLRIGIHDSSIDNDRFPNQEHVCNIDPIGEGGPIVFNYHDCGYSDDCGWLTVEISVQPEGNLTDLS